MTDEMVQGLGGQFSAARTPHAGDSSPQDRGETAAVSGAAGAADALWRRQAPRLVRAAVALGVAPDDAADLVQETLLAAFRALARFDPERASFDAWTHAILVRRCSNWRRGRRRLLRALQRLRAEPAAARHRPDEEVAAQELLDRLIGAMPRVRRRVWALVEVSGLSAADAARALGIREATVRSHLRHVRAARRPAREEPT
jgi:RNA polymerase sigma factor (sigma-70 family)